MECFAYAILNEVAVTGGADVVGFCSSSSDVVSSDTLQIWICAAADPSSAKFAPHFGHLKVWGLSEGGGGAIG